MINIRYHLYNFKIILFVIVLTNLGIVSSVIGNTKNTPHLPISHCYHWLDQKVANKGFLSFKYNYARRNNGELTFYTTPGTSKGSIAGPGLYCAKAPSGSFSYGDRVIRIDFVDDIVLYDATSGRQYCGFDGKFYKTQSKCDQKSWDIKFYSGGGVGNYAWYVIRNPQAIANWSATSSQLQNDLLASSNLNGGAFGNHVSNTLSAIKSEISSRGNHIYQNKNARLSLITIINDPAKVAQIPPLSLISRVYKFQDKSVLNKQKREDIYKEQFLRALKDTKLSYTDYLASIQLGKPVKKVLTKIISTMDFTNIDNKNAVAIMLLVDTLLSRRVTSSINIDQLWRNTLLSKASLNDLLIIDLKNNGIIRSRFDLALPSSSVLIKGVASYNIKNLLLVFNKYLTNKNKNYSVYSKDIFKKILTSSSGDLISFYKKINNKVLGKENAILDVIQDLYKRTRFIGSDPLLLGNLIDFLNQSISKPDRSLFINAIKSLPLVTHGKLAYVHLDELINNNINLPSMINIEDYVVKLIKMSLGERNLAAGKTNTFRIMLSGLYHLYSKVLSNITGDSAKLQEMKKISSSLYKISFGLQGDLLKSYGYILLQNASYFDGSMKYSDHPMSFAFNKYSLGDPIFDQLFENVITKSLDGSFLKMLIFNRKTSKSANVLLNKILNYYVSNEFNNYLTSNEFSIVNLEKKQWPNIIFNKHYTGSNRNKVKSDICQVSKVVYNARKDLANDINLKTLWKLVVKQNQKIYKNNCQ